VPVQIDTGTEYTAIDAGVLAGFGIGPTESVPVRTPSPTGETLLFRRFPVTLGLDREGFEMLLTSVEVMECAFAPEEGLLGLLGRDVLAHCFFFYDGPHKTISLAF
jgi:hypothetical protein